MVECVEYLDMFFVKDLDVISLKFWEVCLVGYIFDEV